MGKKLQELRNEKNKEQKSLENKRDSFKNSLTSTDPLINDMIFLKDEINILHIRKIISPFYQGFYCL